MFVVALFETSYIEDYYPTKNLVGLFESTEAANRRINEIIRNRKISAVKENARHNAYARFEDANGKCPSMYDVMHLKPVFDHTKDRDKEYNKAHNIAVQKWKNEHVASAKEAERNYNETLRLYVENYMNNFRVLDSDIEKIEIENPFEFEVIEVEK